MRIHQFLLAASALLSVSLFVLLGWLSLSSWREHVEDRRSAMTAKAAAAWIDGQVALSLERSVTQVAFALKPGDRGPLIEELELQRRLVDRRFDDALTQITERPQSGHETFESFKNGAVALVERLEKTRVDVDDALRSAAEGSNRATRLVAELIAIIDEGAATRAALSIPADKISTYSLDLLQLQGLAWRSREFAGRARTLYAVATMHVRALSPQAQTISDEHIRLAQQSWLTLKNVLRRLPDSTAIQGAIDKADQIYFTDHLALMARLEAALGRTDQSAQSAVPPFEQFFGASTEALAALADVATVTGREIENYWLSSEAASLQRVWLTALGSLMAIAVTLGVALAVRRHLVRPIVDATSVLSRVAAGELEAENQSARLRLIEIRALHDVVEQFREGLRQAEATKRAALTDHLTGLPNRRDLEDLLSNETPAVFEEGDAFFYIDLDEFKPIDDSFGHDAGDAVLQKVAHRLIKFVGGKNEIWRLGGDDFGLVIRGLGASDIATSMAELLHEIISAPISFQCKELFVGASVGVAIQDNVTLRPRELFSRADAMMLLAKQDPANKVKVYSEAALSRRFSIESRRSITAALRKGDIFPEFQPQVDLASGAVTGFEALARWRRDDGFVMTPGEFMEMVEYFGAQGDLDLVIAEKTLELMRSVYQSTSQKPNFSINVSENSLASREVRSRYLRLFSKYEDFVENLVVEVTENALLDRSAQTIRATLQNFTEAGAKLSMDDFGTGYGSFRHLQEYKFDEIKIDRSFVSKVCFDRSSEVIISGFLAVARGLNAKVVAEGVETDMQRAKLLELGCESAQGFLFGRSAPSADVLEIINTRQPASAI